MIINNYDTLTDNIRNLLLDTFDWNNIAKDILIAILQFFIIHSWNKRYS